MLPNSILRPSFRNIIIIAWKMVYWHLTCIWHACLKSFVLINKTNMEEIKEEFINCESCGRSFKIGNAIRAEFTYLTYWMLMPYGYSSMNFLTRFCKNEEKLVHKFTDESSIWVHKWRRWIWPRTHLNRAPLCFQEYSDASYNALIQKCEQLKKKKKHDNYLKSKISKVCYFILKWHFLKSYFKHTIFF